MLETNFFKKMKPYLGVILLQFGYAGSSIISKSALNQGMNHYTFSVYRNVIAAVYFAPFALVFERKNRPKITFFVFLKILLLALLEPVIDQNLYCIGMIYTTATFTSAMYNLLPAITFVLAWALRLESINLKSIYSQLKIVGTLISVGGAMIMTLVKGPEIDWPWTKPNPISQSANFGKAQQTVKGALILTAGCFCWSIFYIIQASTLKSYPTGLTLTTLICGIGALQGTALTLIFEKNNTKVWSIGWDSKLLACAYTGIICSGVAYYVSGAVMKYKGPVFVTSFNPLSMVIVAIMSSFILAEQLDFGKVTGAIVIVIGLYLVLWGKVHDKIESSCTGSDSIRDQQISTVDEKLQRDMPTAMTSQNSVV